MRKLHDGPPEEKADCEKYLPVLKRIAQGLEPESANLGDEARVHALTCNACGLKFFAECGEDSVPESPTPGISQEVLNAIELSCMPPTKFPN